VPHLYRISNGPYVGDILDSIESVESFARDHGLSSYDVDEHSGDPFLGSHYVLRAWDRAIHYHSGHAVLDSIPQDE
jgi:hypothetical protein